MSLTIPFSGTVRNGKLTLLNEADFRTLVRTFDGQDVTLTLRKASKVKSESQLGFLFGHCLPKITHCLNELGWCFTTEQTREWLQSEYSSETVYNEATKETRKITKSVSQMDKDELSQFVSKISAFSQHELGLIL